MLTEETVTLSIEYRVINTHKTNQIPSLTPIYTYWTNIPSKECLLLAPNCPVCSCTINLISLTSKCVPKPCPHVHNTSSGTNPHYRFLHSIKPHLHHPATQNWFLFCQLLILQNIKIYETWQGCQCWSTLRLYVPWVHNLLTNKLSPRQRSWNNCLGQTDRLTTTACNRRRLRNSCLGQFSTAHVKLFNYLH